MTSNASTVEEYLANLPEDRQAPMRAVRDAMKAAMPEGYEEGMQYGMIGYFVPHSLFPAGYHCDPKQPLNFAGLASQKNAMSLYLMCVYMNPDQEKSLRDAYAEAGKKLDMGKSCIRFKKLENLLLEPVLDIIRATPVEAYLERYQSQLSSRT